MAYLPSYNGIGSIESILGILFTGCKISAFSPFIIKYWNYTNSWDDFTARHFFCSFLSARKAAFEVCPDKRS
jgi:hypothetical protein